MTLAESLQPLVERYDAALLDLDGVVYVGTSPVEHAAEAIRDARAAGCRVAFVTNNASRPPETIAAHLRDLGVAAEAEDVVTSAQAAARLLADRLPAGAPVLVTGAQGLREQVELAGLRVVTSADDEPAAVAQGYSQDLTYADLAEASLAVRAGALWVAANTDTTMPSRRGLLPGNGALVAAVAAATGASPLVAGKPQLPLHREAVARTGARRPLVVGDRLDTDIEGAVSARTPSLLVLTGVCTPAELLAAPPELRPTYVAADLRGLLEPHPGPRPDGEGFTCGQWRATPRDGSVDVRRLRAHGDEAADSINWLRAAAAATWHLADEGRRAAQVCVSGSLPSHASQVIDLPAAR